MVCLVNNTPSITEHSTSSHVARDERSQIGIVVNHLIEHWIGGQEFRQPAVTSDGPIDPFGIQCHHFLALSIFRQLSRYSLPLGQTPAGVMIVLGYFTKPRMLGKNKGGGVMTAYRFH